MCCEGTSYPGHRGKHEADSPGKTDLYTLDGGLRKQVVRYIRDCVLRGVGSVKKVAHSILAGWKKG